MVNMRYVDLPTPRGWGVPPVTRRGVDAALETFSAALSGTAAYWTTASRGGRTPSEVASDGLRWGRLMPARRRPEWASPHRVARSTPLTRLRDFTPEGADDVVPTLVLPPQAGHDSCIVHYSPEQSQIQTIRAAGLHRLFSLDWIGATQRTKDATIDFHAGDAVIHEAVRELSDDDLSFYRNLVALGNGVLKGEFLLGGFIVIQPENEGAKQLQL